MAREDEVMASTPEPVRRIQGVLSAPARLMALRYLTERAMTFAELHQLMGISLAGVRDAVASLQDAGYVVDESPAGRQRRSSTALYTARRDLVTRDAAELIVFLNR